MVDIFIKLFPLKYYNFIMGGCQSSSEEAEMPKLPSSITENTFKTIEKRVLDIPTDLNVKL